MIADSNAVVKVWVVISVEKLEQIPTEKFSTNIESIQETPATTTEVIPPRNTYEKPVYQCIVVNFYQRQPVIIFENITLNETHPYFETSCEHSVELPTHLKLTGQMHTLTSDICDDYPNTEVYKAEDLGIERIHSNAFYGCHELQNLKLNKNKLTALPQNLFLNNQKITTLELSENVFRNIDGKVFQHTPALHSLRLFYNQLEKFPFDDMPILLHLTCLSFGMNKCEDLNMEAVVEKFPKLGPFSCSEN